MSQQRTLNFFRKNDIGYTICQITYEKGCIITPFLYNDYFTTTTGLFLQELNSLENNTLCPKVYNAKLLTLFTNYFSLMEQFISTIHNILYYYSVSKVIPNEKEAKKLFRQDYMNTLNKIFSILKVDNISLKKTKIYNKIKEMEDIRNCILHGNIGSVKITHTNFPQMPLSINCEDIMEHLSILINLFNYFRYIIPNIDLMPSMVVVIGEGIFFKKLDTYFNEILYPYFLGILNKHGLLPTKTYEINTEQLSPTRYTIAKKVEVFHKCLEEPQFKFKMSKENTNLYSKNILNVYNDKEIKEAQGKFQLPAFMI